MALRLQGPCLAELSAANRSNSDDGNGPCVSLEASVNTPECCACRSLSPFALLPVLHSLYLFDQRLLWQTWNLLSSGPRAHVGSAGHCVGSASRSSGRCVLPACSLTSSPGGSQTLWKTCFPGPCHLATPEGQVRMVFILATNCQLLFLKALLLI